MGNAMTANASADKAINSALLQQQLKTAHGFELGGHTYECKALLPLEQVHLARRLAPLVLGALKPESGRASIQAWVPSQNGSTEVTMSRITPRGMTA